MLGWFGGTKVVFTWNQRKWLAERPLREVRSGVVSRAGRCYSLYWVHARPFLPWRWCGGGTAVLRWSVLERHSSEECQ